MGDEMTPEFKPGDRIRVTHICDADLGQKDGLWDKGIQNLIDSKKIVIIINVNAENTFVYTDELGPDMGIRCSEIVLVKHGRMKKPVTWCINK